jgi:heavy metal response regulator
MPIQIVWTLNGNSEQNLIKYVTMKLLLLEDDKDIVRFVRKGLQENSFSVDAASDGENGLFLATHRNYDLIILDIMLPKMDGLEILKRLRGIGVQTPIVFLTARDTEKDIVQGLDLGADDYISKPFSFNEFLSRIRAILRRGKGDSIPPRIQIANLVLEIDGHRVYRDKVKIELTPKEYVLLEYFMRRPGQVITRTMISTNVWDYHFDPGTNVIDVHVSHLRNKIDKCFEPKLLHTIKGVGYVLETRD